MGVSNSKVKSIKAIKIMVTKNICARYDVMIEEEKCKKEIQIGDNFYFKNKSTYNIRQA